MAISAIRRGIALNELQKLGKTLIIFPSSFFTLLRQICMFRLFAKIPGFMFFSTQRVPAGDVAHQLMECADAGAGRDPQRAQELRRAAQAYLRVIR